jgi:PBP1b-binding outer membrane lipoprotein LpoB
MRTTFLLLVLALLVIGCASEPKVEEKAEPASVQDTVDDLDKSLDEIEQLDSELDMTELDQLDQDLDNVSY